MKQIIYLYSFVLLFSCREKDQKTTATHPGKDSTNAIEEKTWVELGGENQYIEITGASAANPVLLFLHGGPGWPQTPHLRYFNAGLTQSMTLVAWDQAGCGKSFMNNPDPKNLSLRQIVEDAHELTQYLKRKFGRDKIYLAGFSWGSMVGLKLIEQYPEDYLAYFGIAQALNLRKSITLSRDWIMQQAQTKNDQESVRILKRLDQGDTTLCKGEMECFIKQHELLSKYGGAVYTKAAEAEILKAETTYEDYKNYDWFAGFTYSAHRLEKDMFETDLTVIKDLKIPVYFLLGRHDWTLPTALTEEFVKNLNAPKKEIIWFEQSGHEVPEEEAPVFNKVLMDRVRN